MGLFANYNKEGPGVYEDDLKHGPFVTFFQIYGSKFFKLCTTNLIFLLFNLPGLVIAYFAAVFFLPLINTTLAPVNFEAYMEKQLGKIEIPDKDIPFLREKLLLMYANPLVNYLAARQ